MTDAASSPPAPSPTPPRAPASPATPSRVRLAWIAFAVVVPLLGFALALASVDPAPPKVIRMATGPEKGAYHRHGLAYQAALAKEGVEVQIRSTRGSAENLELLKEGKVEIAFVQGGVGKAAEHPELRSLASLYYEPLWVFVRAGDAGLNDLRDLKGKKVAVGDPGSGTRPVALGLLELNEVEVKEHDPSNPAQALLARELDALFVIGSPETSSIKKLLEDPKVRPLPFRRAEAYSRRIHYLSPITLPEGVIDLNANVPAKDVPLVATVASLAIRKDDFHPAHSDLLLPVARRLHGEGGVLETPGTFPNQHRLDYPLTDEARRYFEHGLPFLHRYLPFWAANLVSRFKVMLLPLLTLAIPLFQILPPAYAWRQESKLRKLYVELTKLEGEEADEEAFEALRARAAKVPLPPAFLNNLYQFFNHLRETQARIAAARMPQAPLAEAQVPGQKAAPLDPQSSD